MRFDSTVLLFLSISTLVIYQGGVAFSLEEEEEDYRTCVVNNNNPEDETLQECSTTPSTSTLIDAMDYGSNIDKDESSEATSTSSCGLWLAESTQIFYDDSAPLLGIFTGMERIPQTPVDHPDLEVLILNANENEWSLWQDITTTTKTTIISPDGNNDDPPTSHNHVDVNARVFHSGIASHAACSTASVHANVILPQDDAIITTRTVDTATSFSQRKQPKAHIARYALQSGQELLQPCTSNGLVANETEDEHESYKTHLPRTVRSLDWLNMNGICIDTLDVRPSTIPNIGHGAFTKNKVRGGEVIATSAVIQFHRSQMEIVKQFPHNDTRNENENRDGSIYYTEHVLGHQVLLNYCLGHADSNIVLLPYSPGVNYINHHQQKANAILNWSKSKYSAKELLSMPSSEVIYQKKKRLLVEYVALRDIEAGEEIFLDYGPEWQAAWDRYEEEEEEEEAPFDDTQQHYHQPSNDGFAFRHEIIIPNEMLPEKWLAEDPNPMGDFVLPTSMKVGQIEPVRWESTGDLVTPNAFAMQLSPRVRQVLLEYCDKLGITERFRDLTYRGNSLLPGRDENVDFQGLSWYVQRPPDNYKSNMHWISPLERNAHDDYLRALSAAGFDQVLQQMGEYFNLDGLACYHVTFIAVSHCQRGYLHYDVTHTGNRVFNVLIPLILANNTGPELDIQAGTTGDERLPVGRLKYRYDVATLIGDDAYHGTSAVDYRLGKEMRLAATIYVADIRPDNIGSIVSDYTQKYPPPRRPDVLLRMAGDHWKRSDPYAQLPKPFVEDFENFPLPPYKMSPLTWKRTQKPLSRFSHRVGLPFQFQSELVAYFTNLGIIERCQSLFLNDEASGSKNQTYDVGSKNEQVRDSAWQIRGPPKGSHDSEMLWITPGDAKAFDNVVNQLFLLEFQGVLESIGEQFKLDGLVIYGITLVAVSQSEGYAHPHLSDTDGKAFNIVIPLTTIRKSPPEFKIHGHYDQPGRYRFEIDEGLVLGDDSNYITAPVDYRPEGKCLIFLSMYVADMNEKNIESLLVDYGQNYSPLGGEETKKLLGLAGRHWTASDAPRQWWKKRLWT